MQELLTVDLGHLGQDNAAVVDKYANVWAEFKKNNLEKSDSPLNLPWTTDLVQIKKLAEQFKKRFGNILLLGIGGSALGTRAIQQFLNGSFYNLQRKPRLFVLDNLDPRLTAQYEALADWSDTALIYISKSGSTPETAAQFVYFSQKYLAGGGDPQDIVIICDPADNGINALAQELNCHLFHLPHELPGRYSVLSAVGFLPAEMVGIDSQRLLAGARQVREGLERLEPKNNGLFLLAAALHELGQQGKNMHILFNYSSFLGEFGLWFVQLWAESLGKKNNLAGAEVRAGMTPITALGATDQHSVLQLFKEGPLDKVIGFLKLAEWGEEPVLPQAFEDKKEYAYLSGFRMSEQLAIEQMATEMTLVKSGIPCYRVVLRDFSPEVLGGLFFFYEALVVFIAALEQINPYNQPGVEEGKQITYALMGRRDYQEQGEACQKMVQDFDAQRQIWQF